MELKPIVTEKTKYSDLNLKSSWNKFRIELNFDSVIVWYRNLSPETNSNIKFGFRRLVVAVIPNNPLRPCNNN